MRYEPGHKERTRAKILEAAGRLFRRQGFHATGVDRVMEEAGLTSGGFYAHFASKEDLLAEVLRRVGASEGTRGEGETDRRTPEAFVDRYLSPAHRDHPESGCSIVPLISEFGRSGDAIRGPFEAVLARLAARLVGPAAGSLPTDRELAIAALCIGGLGIARSVRDEAFADRVLGACRALAHETMRADAGAEGDRADSPSRSPRQTGGDRS